jgi:hypothetical protein
MNRPMTGILLAAAAIAAAFTISAHDEPSVVLECLDAAGARVGWAEVEAECPTGSTPTKYAVPELCGESCMPCDPLGCEPGTSGCPEPVPVEYLCCLPVCGEQICGLVVSAVECSPDNLIFECDCPFQHANGDVECLEC